MRNLYSEVTGGQKIALKNPHYSCLIQKRDEEHCKGIPKTKRKFFQATAWWALRGGGLLGLDTSFHSHLSTLYLYKSPYTKVWPISLQNQIHQHSLARNSIFILCATNPTYPAQNTDSVLNGSSNKKQSSSYNSPCPHCNTPHHKRSVQIPSKGWLSPANQETKPVPLYYFPQRMFPVKGRPPLLHIGRV